MTILYALGAALAVAIAWFAFKVLLGRIVPLEKSSYAYLQQTLKRMGVAEFVPPACIRECAEQSVKHAKIFSQISGESSNIQERMVEGLDIDADMLRDWVRGSDPFSSSGLEHYKTLFEKYGVQRLGK